MKAVKQVLEIFINYPPKAKKMFTNSLAKN